MNQLTFSQTSCITHSFLTSNHGKQISAIAMHVDDDGQRIADRIQHQDIMDTTLDNPPQPSFDAAHSQVPAKDQIDIPGAQPAPPLDSSAEKEVEAQQSADQTRKIPH